MIKTECPVKIVTDSSAHLPVEQRQKHDIAVVPLKAIFGNEVYRDEIDLSNEQFYQMLPKSKFHPTTSQPSAGEFEEVYRPLLQAGREIVSLHLPSTLSGTYASACAAKVELETQLKRAVPLTIVDTPWLSMALGMLCIAAAQAAEAGKSSEEIVSIVNALIPRMNLIFVLDTLEYLRRGGRIGGARAMLGSMLNVKPILQIEHGQVEPLEQPRSRRRAVKRLIEIMEERTDRKPIHVSILHAMDAEGAASLEKELRSRFECREFYVTVIGPVIGVHTGPSAIGLAFYSD
ncbi:MAG: DegV family protein [Chloroflexi bacterium]|nr:DegV family protein [Chloroflexota bacterium]